jgi:hypothetical protein
LRRDFWIYVIYPTTFNSFWNLIVLLWILVRKPWKSASLLIATSLAITLFFPATLIYRNHKAIGLNTISTNLGGTMNIGAGDKAEGGYASQEVGCLVIRRVRTLKKITNK